MKRIFHHPNRGRASSRQNLVLLAATHSSETNSGSGVGGIHMEDLICNNQFGEGCARLKKYYTSESRDDEGSRHHQEVSRYYWWKLATPPQRKHWWDE